MSQEILYITENKRGRKSIQLPHWVVTALLTASGIKSGKNRQVRKTIKAQFCKAIRKSLNDYYNCK